MRHLRWLRPWSALCNRTAVPRRARSARPRLEALEERTLLSFFSAVNYPTGSAPVTAVLADFNNDGILDIATSDYVSNSMSVLLGNGDGTFRAPVRYSAGANPQCLVVGDFNGDGHPDLAVVNFGSSTISVFLGNGDGTFRPAVNYPSGPSPQFIAAADVNGDGKLDLITADSGSNTVSVLLGNGDGTFQPRRSFFCNTNPNAIAVGDFNEDGKVDLAITNGGLDLLTILRGNGDGTFQPPVSMSTDRSPLTVTAADLTGDGHLDLITANNGAASIQVFSGRGDGTFQPPIRYTTDGGPRSVVVDDFNRDGIADLAVCNDGANTVNVFLGRGDGTFQNSSRYNTAGRPSWILAGDFNNDGFPDLATANFNGSNVSVLLNDGIWPQFDTFAFSGPTQTTAGDTLSFTLAARQNGAIDTGYTGTVHFASSDTHAGLPADYTFTAADQGQHTFDVVLRTAGSQTVTAADTAGGFTGTTGAITVSPAAASVFSVTGLPGSITAGSIQFFTVRTLDAYGNFATDYTGTAHFTSSDPQASLPADYAFTAADHGSHVFPVVLRTAGTQSVTATDTSDPTSTGTQGGIAVLPAAASTFLVTGFPDSVAGQIGAFTVTAEDAYGNLATGYTGTVRLGSSDPRATLSANYTFSTADRGSHLFGAVLYTAGVQSLTATDLFSPAVTGTQGDIYISAAAPSGLRFGGFPGTTVAGTPATFTVTAVDAYGNTAPTYAGTVSFTSSDPQASLPTDYTFTTADQGTHIFGAVLYTAGPQTLTATDAADSLGDSESGITVRAASASYLRIDGLPASAAVGEPVTFTVTLLDAYGNVATGYTGTVRFTSSDRRALLPAAYTFTAQDGGSRTFAAVFRTRGGVRLTAADRVSSGLQETLTIRVTP